MRGSKRTVQMQASRTFYTYMSRWRLVLVIWGRVIALALVDLAVPSQIRDNGEVSSATINIASEGCIVLANDFQGRAF